MACGDDLEKTQNFVSFFLFFSKNSSFKKKHCFIDLKRQSEYSVPCPDTSSLVSILTTREKETMMIIIIIIFAH